MPGVNRKRSPRPIIMVAALWSIAQGGALAATEEILFNNAGVELSGTLHFPRTTPKAGIVLIHGSSKKDSLRMTALADLLADAGFAVLTYDKRGIGKSGGVFQTGDDEKAFALLAEDAAAAFRKLQTHTQLTNIPLGLLGISQGGWVAPLVAAQLESVAFMVLWSGPICTVSEEMHFSSFAKRIPNFSVEAESSRVKTHMKSAPSRRGEFDPRHALSELFLPALWIFGGRDNSIPVELSIRRLEELIKDGHPNFEYKLFPEQGHGLDYPTPYENGYAFMVDWIEDVAASAAQQTPVRDRAKSAVREQ